MDDLGVRGELADVAGDPVVETHPYCEDQVGAVYGPVDAGLAVHPRPPQIQRMVVRERADTEQRRDDRDSGPLGEQPQLFLRPG